MKNFLRLVFTIPVIACLLAAEAAAAGNVVDDTDAVRELVRSGATQLALRRIDALQPADSAAPGWVEWQRLRLQLLADSGGHEELLRRISALPPQLSQAQRTEFYLLAAQSALMLGRFAEARDHAGRALWADGIDPVRVRAIRLLVIRSHVREGKASDAYRSMLRFQQDYRPLEKPVATWFVDGLLDLGLVKEAVNWLGLLDERGATKLRLRLHTGLIPPQEVMAQVRKVLAKDTDPQWWRVLLDAALRQQDAASVIEARERLLNHEEAADITASGLWESYIDFARRNANAYQLLSGDEQSWLDFALRRRSETPVVTRAYLAYLARESAAESMRKRAQDELAAMFAMSGLSRTALRVFNAWPGNASVLPVNARHVLGDLALKLGDQPRALDYLGGAPAPIDVPLLAWDVRLAALALQAGSGGIAAEMSMKIAAGKPQIGQPLLPAWIALARRLVDHGLPDAALALFEGALSLAGPAQMRGLLSGIALAHESRSQPLLAADYHLRSASLAAVPDEAAAESRLRAGLALARAGLREDARAQFEWLLKHSKNQLHIDAARRELGRPG